MDVTFQSTLQTLFTAIEVYIIDFTHTIMTSIIFQYVHIMLSLVTHQDTNNHEQITFHRNLNQINQIKHQYEGSLQNAMNKFILTHFGSLCNISKISFKHLFYVEQVYTR